MDINQRNNTAVWDFWQRLNHVGEEELPSVIRRSVSDDVGWNVSVPIHRIRGVEAL